jgi:beta-phosphoglucomutase-like phosphatase (HAD superfamily)
MTVSLVVFDLAGTTVQDDNYVTGCLWKAAQEFEVPTTEQEISRNIGTNKRHLYRWLIARSQGRELDLQQMGTCRLDEAGEQLADATFERYEELMIETYRTQCREVPGTTECFQWLKERGIKIATDTGFHGAINAAIFERLGWLESGLGRLLCARRGHPRRARPTRALHAVSRDAAARRHQSA